MTEVDVALTGERIFSFLTSLTVAALALFIAFHPEVLIR
jgi:hypothetical protein